MIVKIPQEVLGGAHTHRVVFRRNLKNDEGYKATIQFRTQEIAVDPEQPPAMMLASFLHEVCHEINERYGCGLSEENLSRLGEGFAEFLTRSCGIEFDWSDIQEK